MTRADRALVERGLARSRGQAAQLIAAGEVSNNGDILTKPSQQVAADDELAVAHPDHYVSRAAHKLLGALNDSGLDIAGRVLDAGASTGGFSQVLLERGADHIYAVDVGHDQLAAIVRDDPRVTVWERTNLRDLTLDHVSGEAVDLVVADVSFISLQLLLTPLLRVLRPDGAALLMVKPQFELDRSALDARGVVRNDRLRSQAVADLARAATRMGWETCWQGESRLPGPSGNREYFLLLRRAP